MSEARNRGNANPQSRLISWGVIAFIALILIIGFSNATFLTIDNGERGVLFKRFSGGLDKENIYQPGFHIIAPWNVMHVFDVREQQVEEEMLNFSRYESTPGRCREVPRDTKMAPRRPKMAQDGTSRAWFGA